MNKKSEKLFTELPFSEGLNNINITELGTNIGSNYLSMNPLNQTVDTGDKLTLEDLKDKIVGVASILNPIKPAGASELDIANGNAVVSINSDGGLEFKALDPFAQWDNESGQKVIKEFKDSSKCIKVSDDFMVKLKQRIKEQNG